MRATVVLEDMDVARVNPKDLAEIDHQCTGPLLHLLTLPYNGGHPMPGGGGGDSRSPSYPVNEVHQARMTERWGIEDGFWRGQKEGSFTGTW